MIYFGEPPPGTRWGFIVHHLGDYMRRWILRTPWGTLRVHNILRSDLDRDMHDHPFDFTSLILWGGYVETVPDHPNGLEPWKGECADWHGPGSVIRHRAEDLHRLWVPEGKTAWTLVFTGPWRRHWGFATKNGWVPWREYVNAEPVDDPLKTRR